MTIQNEELAKEIQGLKSTNNLFAWVIDDILEDTEGYRGTEIEQLESRLSEILEHGCISGTVSSLVYYSDTKKFYEEHKEDINALLYENMEECGVYELNSLFGDKFDKEDPLCIDTTNQNLLAWFGYEEVTRKLMYIVNPEY